MKFGVRECTNIVFRAKSKVTIGNTTFQAGQPVLYIDTAKTSTLEGAATSVYATGGRGNPRLITWEGERTLTFTVEDALLSPLGFSILSGAGLLKNSEANPVHVHKVVYQNIKTDGVVDVSGALEEGETFCADAPIFVLPTEWDGSIAQADPFKIKEAPTASSIKLATEDTTGYTKYVDADHAGTTVMVDFYATAAGEEVVHELQIDAENFAGYYYVEADTLFRRQDTGKDMPAILTLPNVKIQSNFTFTMAGSGDPSTFTFTMDAMPGYTYFNKKKKVLCVVQIIESTQGASTRESVMPHNTTSHTSLHDENDVTGRDGTTAYKDGTFMDSWVNETANG